MDYSKCFFEAIDKETEHYAEKIRNKVFSLYPDMPWTSDQYQALQPAVRQMLDDFVQSLLGIFDNVGCTRVPDGVLGYRIKAIPAVLTDDNVLEAGEEADIRNSVDYADMWTEYISPK